MEQPLKQLISKKKLDSCIEILGRVGPENMPNLYRNSDIYISASMLEGMSNSMLEALASGLPIITTRCEGLDELLNSNNGIIVENAGSEEISNAIIKLSNDRQKLKQMSIAARQQAENFSWTRTAEKYIQLYEQQCIKRGDI